ncbi:HNH endonuclease signature motif containing protein [Isoptericola variabilis]|uniref:HNH nuclease n=1 Tax=Isoptericola variabilis (strain 225) TaxID=743718 RepID=F6FQS4_ISOV2|nr:HNH endonuclease signature motif containing protein [Isoptericola variabilis]AEG42889.1 HNH nuclease [Isoptericola variabilis 225]TWH30194.1 uncharacterized protein DUF222 [Isoptericola variabilis J7]
MTATTDAATATSRGRALSEVLQELQAVVEELTAVVAAELEDGGPGEGEPGVLAEASAVLRRAGQRLDAARWAVLPALETDGRWALDGSRSFAHWLARAEDVTLATARRDVRTAAALHETLRSTRSAALRGEVGGEHVRALVDVAPTSAARRAALAAPVEDGRTDDAAEPGEAERPTGEEVLLDLAQRYPVGPFRQMVRRFAQVADPESDERGYRQATEREFFDISPTWGGYHLAGFLTEEHGQALRTAVEAVMGRPAADDTRTPAQRRAQALVDLVRVALDNAAVGTGAAVRPHLTVTVSWTELTTLIEGIGEESGEAAADGAVSPAGSGGVDVDRIVADGLPRFPDGRGPIPPSLLRRLACDAEVTRIVFGPDSQVLDVGRSRRTVTGQLRRAVVARDGHCTWPGCEEPPNRCEVHHAVTHWADGGSTSVHNAALLCWHHHARVDGLGIAMRYDGGTWRFTDRRGREIGARTALGGSADDVAAEAA